MPRQHITAEDRRKNVPQTFLWLAPSDWLLVSIIIAFILFLFPKGWFDLMISSPW